MHSRDRLCLYQDAIHKPFLVPRFWARCDPQKGASRDLSTSDKISFDFGDAPSKSKTTCVGVKSQSIREMILTTSCRRLYATLRTLDSPFDYRSVLSNMWQSCKLRAEEELEPTLNATNYKGLTSKRPGLFVTGCNSFSSSVQAVSDVNTYDSIMYG